MKTALPTRQRSDTASENDPDELVRTRPANGTIGCTELIWPGKYDEHGRRVEQPMLSFPFQVVEVIAEGGSAQKQDSTAQLSLFDSRLVNPVESGWRNKLIWGDNLMVEASLREEFAGKIDLIYIDPPFATGVDFSFKAPIGDQGFKESLSLEQKAYGDRWTSGSKDYCEMMAARLELMRELLSASGSIFVHLDWHFSHLVRVILDEVFGSQCFINEIVVNRGRRKNLQGQFERISSLGAEHDVLLLYAKSLKANYRHVRSRVRARKEQWQSLWRGNIERPTMQYELLGFEPKHGQFLWSKERALRAVSNYQAFLHSGKEDLLTYWEETGRKLEFVAMLPGRAYPQYWLPPKQAGLLGDVWTDIQSYSYTQGYETEKHEELLARVIEMASDPGELVADFFCGSGTTLAVAEKLGRRWIGCDIGNLAIHVTRKRLLDLEFKDIDSKNKRRCRPFEVLCLGKHERAFWLKKTFDTALYAEEKSGNDAYEKFILKLYRAQPLPSGRFHGRKDGAVIYVGAVDEPIGFARIEALIAALPSERATELHVLGWEFESELQERLTESFGPARDILVRLVRIPHETMENRVLEAGDLRFFDLAFFHVELEALKGGKSHRSLRLTLRDFILPYADFVSDEVKTRIKKWSDHVDYWAVDWDFRRGVFVNRWRSYRTRRSRLLALKTPVYTYDKCGLYEIMVKVVDIFGNDTSRVFRWEVK
ncbi:MAG: site-specific DNA-methyltransferase [Deltaproteobacteria bacterium]|nr:site-specific DNA-methyltransferase [Deltaproteobacteria bacterium]